MSLLSSLFGLGVRSRNTLYDRGLLRARQLRGPVISVGNLSVGGSGKTPFVMLLGELLKERGIKFDILSRGYGRADHWRRDRGSHRLGAGVRRRALLMARRLQVPVVVGEDRYQAGLLAEERFGARLHILDDGFQHRALARDFDIVLVTPEDAQRSPASSRPPARAASVLCAAPMPWCWSAARLWNRFRLRAKLVWQVRRGILRRDVPPGPWPSAALPGRRIFSGNCVPQEWNPSPRPSYRDHHAYTEQDVQELLELRPPREGGGYVTTEKDAINLGEHLCRAAAAGGGSGADEAGGCT